MEKKILKKYKAVTKRVETFFKTDNEMQIRKVWNHHQKEIWINRVNKCPTCDVKLTKKNCTKEHIHPLVLGGAESDENITPMCEDCNKARNSVMTEYLGSTSHKKLRSKWPENQEKINHFVIWCYVSLGSHDENRHFFTDLEQSFAKKRGIAFNEGSVKIKNQPKRWYSGLLGIGQSLFSKADEEKEEIDKLEYKCLELSCQRTIYLPKNFQDIQRGGRQLRCPHCKTIVGQSEIKKSANKKAKTESESSDVSIDQSPVTKFNLEEWLMKNWQGPESSKEIYVKLKIAISEHEKAMVEPRNIRQVMHEDLGLSKNSSIEQITSKLESLYREIESKPESVPISIEQNPINEVEVQNSVREFILSQLDESEWLSAAHLGNRITEYWKRNEYSNAQDFKSALGFEKDTKTMKIVTSLCGNFISVKEETNGAVIHHYLRKSPTWFSTNWKGGKESYDALKQHLSQVEFETRRGRKIRDILKQDFEIPKSWTVEKIIRHFDSKYSSN